MAPGQNTITCSNCSSIRLVNWKYCPSCGAHLITEGKLRMVGRRWCNRCKENRNINLTVWDGKDVHYIEAKYCHICGTKLENTVKEPVISWDI
ncbi:MAG: hypothetical protein UU77_C0001G0034 [candidate division WWE3 bacterium GW2011_GWC1_41_7]|uniref:DZANK-type domain-containing protein n=4 Tax=Katanobacteria TaxID=422282 RepID=A0A0G0X918_UNCKA|nr:MAG: hypothetical protein UU72_C0003G0035 [candidate division WWE3 bacterium GW2011_GWB1_41_6]KKS21539.1 MAG: hypothetical protein UU77_C0001G0034 [candidate division WWE3 bacterium GW2011_GWC1_41_7]KKS22503.1 MAG: hypothetical protein UU80_C0006G0029 [candidate division WWE3 bacterium GW2011_GWA1_41_8]OGC56905.1 MAG: hypothetical protein A2976_00615 [candidate division WWE3 bacterium RIFCSPLOWO2_01_FULL_41_9]